MPSPAVLLIALLMMVGAALGGFLHGVEYQDGRQAKLDRARQDAEARALAAFWTNQRIRVATIGKRLADARADRDEYARALRDEQRKPHASPTICPADGGAARLSDDGLRRYNRALAVGVSGPDRAAWLDGANPPADPAQKR